MKKNSIFPALVLIFSVLEILQSLLGPLNWLALINSAIGTVGATLFFTKNENYRKFISAWIYLQAVVITKTVMGADEPIFDLSQFFHLKFGFYLSFNETSYGLNFNFLTPVYFVLFRKLQIDGLIGNQLALKLYRENDVLSSVLPQTITVLEKINFNKGENWLLSELSQPIHFNERTFQFCLIKAKDDVPIVPKQKSQMAYLRLVEDVGLMKVSPLNDNIFVDWVFVS